MKKALSALIIMLLLVVSITSCGENKKIVKQETQKEVLQLGNSQYIDLEAIEPSSKKLRLELTELYEMESQAYDESLGLGVFAEYCDKELGVRLDNSWRAMVHFYTQDKTAGMLQLQYFISEIGTNKSIIFSINNDIADNVYYSCLDMDTDEDMLLKRVKAFKERYEQEKYKLKDGESLEGETTSYMYQYHNQKLVYSYSVFFRYGEYGVINNDYGTECIIDENSNAIYCNESKNSVEE